MANTELKKFVLDNGLYKRYAKARHESYINNDISYLNSFEFDMATEYGQQWFEIVEECKRVGNSSYQRVKRLKTRIKDILKSGECSFLTLTFKDEVLTSTTFDSRRDMVINFLKLNGCEYVANIDYGKLNEREHYHALINSQKVDYTLWHENGAIRGEKVRLRKNCETKLAKYIDKLALHSVKDSTCNNRLIYSRRCGNE